LEDLLELGLTARVKSNENRRRRKNIYH
jgi:hypothetical protein